MTKSMVRAAGFSLAGSAMILIGILLEIGIYLGYLSENRIAAEEFIPVERFFWEQFAIILVIFIMLGVIMKIPAWLMRKRERRQI